MASRNAYPFAPLLPITIPARLVNEVWREGYDSAAQCAALGDEYRAELKASAEAHYANSRDLEDRLWLDLQAAGHHYGERVS